MKRSRFNVWQVSILAVLVPVVAQALTVTVVNTSNSGAGSLRQAITDVNTSVDPSNTIDFNIPGSPPHTITPVTYLSQINNRVLIDGFSQSGYVVGVPAIILDGSGVGGAWTGLRFNAAESSVRGLDIRNWGSEAINLYASDCTVLGCHLMNSVNSGIRIYDADGCTIGGTTTAEKNVISGNGYAGIDIFGETASGNAVLGNYIGVDSSGLAEASNTYYGVYVSQGSSNTIGGTSSGARNVISGNGSAGVSIVGASATGNVILGNYIGTDATGGAVIGNGEYGIMVAGPETTIGGASVGAGNVIAGSGWSGIYVTGDNSVGVLVAGNLIGTDATGLVPLTNEQHAIHISYSPSNTIGGATALARNVICASGDGGINISGNTSVGNTVLGNYIGVAADGVTALPNCWSGISQGAIHVSSSGTTIGGANPGEGNVISGNARYGIHLSGTNAVGNTVMGNMIGLGADGVTAVGNDLHGIFVYKAISNTIGGTSAGVGNFIAHNGQAGVAVVHSNAFGNAILGNSIHANGWLGIDLEGDNSVESMDWGDADTGANGLQNFPFLSSATFGSTIVSGQLLGKTNVQYRIELFASPTSDASGYGEGGAFIGWTNILTGMTGEGNFTITVPVSVAKNHYVTATATDPENNTSEFSIFKEIVFLDNDADGIEGNWEADHSLSDVMPNTGDTDNDGFSDLEEFYADTHPTNANDYPRITAISNSANPVVYFPSSSARLYRIKVASDLRGSNTWKYIGPRLPGNGGAMSLDAPPGADLGFCRIEVELP